MPLLNYTTIVPVPRTINDVHNLLVKAGARRMLTEYDANGKPSGIQFELETSFGLRGFVLPVDVKAVHDVLWADTRIERKYRTSEHAERVAWRIAKDWLEAQLAIVESHMVSFDQVMLPYMASGKGATVYEEYRDQQRALEAAK